MTFLIVLKVQQELHRFVNGDAAGIALVAAEPQLQQQLVPAALPDGLQQFDAEPGPVLQGAAVFIGALVVALGAELVDELVVAPVEQDSIHAELGRRGTAGGEIVDDLADLLLGQVRQSAAVPHHGRHGHFSVALSHGAHIGRRRLLVRVHIVPNRESAVGELDKGQSVMPMHGADILLNTLFHLDIHRTAEVQPAAGAHATGDGIVVGGDPGGAAGGLDLVELQVVLVDTSAGVGNAEPQRACQHTVFEYDISHLIGTEQIGILGFH